MAKFIPLPDGSKFPVKEGESAAEAWAEAQRQFPEAFTPTTPDTAKGGFAAAAKAGLSSLKSDAAAVAGRTGLMDIEAAEKYRAEQEAYRKKTFKPTEEGWSDAPWTKFKETLGGSLPYMAAPIAAGAAAIPLGTGALGLGVGAGLAGLVSGGQFTGSNLSRQIETGKKLADTDLGVAAAAAVPMAALDIVGFKMIPGIRQLFGAAGKEISEEAAKKIAEQGTKGVLADYGIHSAKAAGVEGTTEAGQQFFERLQAGLSTGDAKAREEYIESFIGGAVLGGTLGAPGRAFERGQIKSKGAALEQTRLGEERKAAAEADAAYKATPEYLTNLQRNMVAAQTKQRELEAAAVKPGKGASQEERVAYRDAQRALSEFNGTTMAPLAVEYKAALPRIEEAARQETPGYQAEMALEGGQAVAPEETPPAPIDTTAVENEKTQRRADLSGQIRGIQGQLDDMQAQSEAAETPEASVQLGRQHEQMQSALTAAQAELDTLGVAKGVPNPMKQLEAAQKRWTTAKEQGDVPAAAKHAARVLELQTEIGGRPIGQIEMPTIKTGGKSEPKSTFAARVYKPGAADIEAQELASIEENRLADETAAAESAREVLIAPEQVALRRMGQTPTPSVGTTQVSSEVDKLVEGIVSEAAPKNQQVQGRVITGAGADRADEATTLRAKLSYAYATNNKSAVEGIRKQLANMQEPDTEQGAGDLESGITAKDAGVEGKLSQSAMLDNRVTRLSQAQLSTYDRLASFVEGVRNGNQNVSDARKQTLRSAADELKNRTIGLALNENDMRRAQAGMAPLTDKEKVSLVGPLESTLTELIERGTAMFEPVKTVGQKAQMRGNKIVRGATERQERPELGQRIFNNYEAAAVSLRAQMRDAIDTNADVKQPVSVKPPKFGKLQRLPGAVAPAPKIINAKELRAAELKLRRELKKAETLAKRVAKRAATVAAQVTAAAKKTAAAPLKSAEKALAKAKDKNMAAILLADDTNRTNRRTRIRVAALVADTEIEKDAVVTQLAEVEKLYVEINNKFMQDDGFSFYEQEVLVARETLADINKSLTAAIDAKVKLLDTQAADTTGIKIIKAGVKAEAVVQKARDAVTAAKRAEIQANNRLAFIRNNRPKPLKGETPQETVARIPVTGITQVFRDTADVDVQKKVANFRGIIGKGEADYETAREAGDEKSMKRAADAVEAAYNSIYGVLNNAPLKKVASMMAGEAEAMDAFYRAQETTNEAMLAHLHEVSGIRPLKMRKRRMGPLHRKLPSSGIIQESIKPSVAAQEKIAAAQKQSPLELIAVQRAEIAALNAQLAYIEANKSESAAGRARQNAAKKEVLTKRAKLRDELKAAAIQQSVVVREAKADKQAEKALYKETRKMARREEATEDTDTQEFLEDLELREKRTQTERTPASVAQAPLAVLEATVAALPDAQTQKLEDHYGVKSGTTEFFAKLQADVVLYSTKGAQAVAKTIRGVIKAITEGVLAASLIFNPAGLTAQDKFDFNLPQTYKTTVTTQVKATVPANATSKMSTLAQSVYESMAPTAKASGKGFIIADKPNGMLHVFFADGSLLVQDTALYGKDIGDIEGKVSSLKGGPKITPAGKFTLVAMPDAEYVGGVTLALAETWSPDGIIAVHAAYLGNPEENRLARLDTPSATDNRISYGCVNTSHELFINKIMPNLDALNGGMIFVLPDAQAATAAMFPANTTTTVLESTKKTESAAAVSARSIERKEENVANVAATTDNAFVDGVGNQDDARFATVYDAKATRTMLDAVTNEAMLDGRLMDALDSLAQVGATPLIRENAAKLMPFVLRTKVLFDENLQHKGEDVPAVYAPSKNAVIFRSKSMSEEDIIHEVTHAATVRVMAMPDGTLTPTQLAAKRELIAMYNKLAADPKFKNQYAVEDAVEFVAEIQSNSDLRALMDKQPWFRGNMLARAFRAIMKLIGFTPAETESAKAQRLIESIYMPSKKLDIAATPSIFRNQQAAQDAEGEVTPTKAIKVLDPFPILRGYGVFPKEYEGLQIPTSLIAKHDAQLQLNHGQDLATIRRRGGLNPIEALAVISDKSYYDIESRGNPSAVRAALDVLIAEHLGQPAPAPAAQEQATAGPDLARTSQQPPTLSAEARKQYEQTVEEIKQESDAANATRKKLVAEVERTDKVHKAALAEANRLETAIETATRNKDGGVEAPSTGYSSVSGAPPSFKENIIGNLTGLPFRTQFIDNYAALNAAFKKGLTAGQITDLEAEQSQYYMRTSRTVNQLSSQVLRDGPLQRVAQATGRGTEYSYTTKSGVNMVQVAEQFGKAKIGNNAKTEGYATLYQAGRRAAYVGWAKLNFKDPAKAEAEYKAMMVELRAKPEAEDAFKEGARLYDEYNKGLINMLVEFGVLTRKKAAELNSKPYVPFYRNKNGIVDLMIDSETSIRIGDIKTEKQLHGLVGDDTPILPMFTSAVQNTHLLVDMAVRNQTIRDTALTLYKIGIATIVDKGRGPANASVVRFYEDGEPHYAIIDNDMYGIPADLIVKGMEGIKTSVPAIVRAMGIPADLLRKFVTRAPVYALRQVIRDPLNAYLTTGVDGVPVLGALKELGAMVAGRSDVEKRLMQAGVISSNVFTGDIRDSAAVLKGVASGRSGWAKLLAKADAFAIQGDAATRATIYKDSIAKGMSEMQALTRTLESTNFSRRGLSSSMHVLSTLIPFFNAQIQGMDVLYRAFKGDMPYSEQLKIRQKLFARGTLLAIGTIAYAAMMQDDEAYKRAKPEERYGSWFMYVPGFDEPVRVPIPFELGFLFKALPEAIFNMAAGDEKAGEAAKGLSKLLVASQPLTLPHAVKPITEAVLGRSFYGGDIESKREQGVQSAERFRENTTELAKMLGSVTDNVGLSPIKIDHLIRGYTGSLGIGLLQLANPIIGDASSRGEAPTTKSSKLPLIGTLFQPIEGRGTIDAAYAAMESIKQAQGTYKKMVEEGRRADAALFAQEYSAQMAMASTSGEVYRQLGEWAKQERQVRMHPKMSTAQKDVVLERLDKAKVAYARRFMQAVDRTIPQ